MTTSAKSTQENPEENLLGIYFDTVRLIGPNGVLQLLSKVLKGAVFDPCCRRAAAIEWMLSSACHARVSSWEDFEYLVARLFESMLLEAFVQKFERHAENALKESQRKQADLTLEELILEEEQHSKCIQSKSKRRRKKSK